jgi:4,5-DOPA dioxygenase extradiol
VFSEIGKGDDVSDILPAIFFGHGNPMNALLENAYTEAWRRIGQDTSRPRAILSISAHFGSCLAPV